MFNRRVAVCAGEPAGVGVELCLCLSTHQQKFPQIDLVILCDIALLEQRAEELGVSVTIIPVDQQVLSNKEHFSALAEEAKAQGNLLVYPLPLAKPSVMGKLEEENAPYVLDILSTAHRLCVDHLVDALLTLPVHKGIINRYLKNASAQEHFSGHTEFFQKASHCDEVVMVLACEKICVALATTHIPLAQVTQHITANSLEKKLTIINKQLGRYGFGSDKSGEFPRVAVLGLNPHAGEGGYIGEEEQQIIQPLVNKLQQQEGWAISGVFSADTAFIAENLPKFDCFFGMYHDQVLPIIKHLGFHKTTNITLGLPYPRVSVDHGTALDIVGTDKVNNGSLLYSLQVLNRLLSE
jgi:4-hydroxythreonine-4-phosphate dehydrogenase